MENQANSKKDDELKGITKDPAELDEAKLNKVTGGTSRVQVSDESPKEE